MARRKRVATLFRRVVTHIAWVSLLLYSIQRLLSLDDGYSSINRSSAELRTDWCHMQGMQDMHPHPLCTQIDNLELSGRDISKRSNQHNNQHDIQHNKSISISNSQRTRSTPVDIYYSKHGKVPPPSQMHVSLPDQWLHNTAEYQNILIIGDVHGCYNEMIALWKKAKHEVNDNKDFQYVILVGDMCNKGPDSVKVIHHVRQTPRWLTVRGNNDHRALQAALGDVVQLNSGKFDWMMDDKSHLRLRLQSQYTSPSDDTMLSDADVSWMAGLPYTIKIPSQLMLEKHDTLIVHAGLIPNLDLEHQTISTMLTVLDIEDCMDDTNKDAKYNDSGAAASTADTVTSTSYTGTEHGRAYRYSYLNSDCNRQYPWASQWAGPYRVIFGHDAGRGLQQYTDGWTIGIDTAAVYGQQLTGLVLPYNKLVQIDVAVDYTNG
jgi:predicted phosphodiesterase